MAIASSSFLLAADCSQIPTSAFTPLAPVLLAVSSSSSYPSSSGVGIIASGGGGGGMTAASCSVVCGAGCFNSSTPSRGYFSLYSCASPRPSSSGSSIGSSCSSSCSSTHSSSSCHVVSSSSGVIIIVGGGECVEAAWSSLSDVGWSNISTFISWSASLVMISSSSTSSGAVVLINGRAGGGPVLPCPCRKFAKRPGSHAGGRRQKKTTEATNRDMPIRAIVTVDCGFCYGRCIGGRGKGGRA